MSTEMKYYIKLRDDGREPYLLDSYMFPTKFRAFDTADEARAHFDRLVANGAIADSLPYAHVTTADPVDVAAQFAALMRSLDTPKESSTPEPRISLPRRIVEALVVAASDVRVVLGEDWAEALCPHCDATIGENGHWGNETSITAHATSCPVRFAQDALAQQDRDYANLERITSTFTGQDMTRESLAEMRQQLEAAGLERFVPNAIADVAQDALREPQIACDEHGEPLPAIYRDYESTPELEALIASLSPSERILVELRSKASGMATIEQLVRTVVEERRQHAIHT